MFGWFRKKPVRLEPEGKWNLGLDAEAISVTDADGQVKSLALSNLAGVIIETNDSGPWGADVWWLLFGKDDRLACAFPQGATGEEAVVDYLSALPAFDHGTMINAMTSTGNGVFPVWRKPT